MAEPSDSFKRFNYLLRPSKQVERKILLEVLLHLADASYSIKDYTYVGFGSVFYADFVLFHKYLYIKKMFCVEWSDIPKRMRFNKPYRFIALKMKPLSEFIPELSSRRRYLVWLDYDRPLDAEMLRDISGCIQRLSAGSIFLVTAEARARLPDAIIEEEDLADASAKKLEKRLVQLYRAEFGWLIRERITQDRLSPAEVPRMFWEAINSQIRDSMKSRDGLHYTQLFNFKYADGAQMLTVGGIIGDPGCEAKLEGAGVLRHPFVERAGEPIKISVPPLTIREKQWLDSHLSSGLTWDKIAFELEEELFGTYAKFYLQYPTYVESLV